MLTPAYHWQLSALDHSQVIADQTCELPVSKMFNAPSHPNRATKPRELMPTPRGRRPPPTQGGGSGLSYHTFVEGR